MANPNSRQTLIDYCKRRLGDPVIEVNVDEDQLEDRVDEALQYFREYHSEATYRGYIQHQVTQTDIDNKYIDISSNVQHVTKLFKLQQGIFSRNMFSIKYQMHMNDIANMHSYIGDLAYYEQVMQYMSLLDMRLNGTPQVDFVRKQNRLYIHGNFEDEDVKVDEYLVAEVYSIISGDDHTAIWNDLWLKEYTTALIKLQWGSNLIKFEGMQMPGGVTLNGRQLYEDAMQELERLREKLRNDHELPVDFFIG
jgi:hypothetical protein|tara:strand:+ start:150 stop:902 length:753 start_codon:yes stop_codon:yes gene_type:complete